jgi:molybdenum cofactor cytidylyltransferase
MPRMPGPAERPVAGLVLAAGGSRRLGTAKQLLPYGETTLLDHVLRTARACPFDQLLCVLGGESAAIRAGVDLSGVEVVENPDYGLGCSSSIAAALGWLDPACETLVLMLGDQPGVRVDTVAALLAGRGDAALAACSYADGLGHPLAFGRSIFDELGRLHGDKAVWKLLDRHARVAVKIPIPGRVPPDVDTWEDYDALVKQG